MKQIYILLIPILLILVFRNFAFAQDINVEKQRAYLLYSPFHAAYTHYNNLKAKNYSPAKAAAALYPYSGLTQQQKEELAVQLKQILDGNGLYIFEEKIPKEMNFYDSTAKKYRFVPFKDFPEIYIEKTGNQWFYSQETLLAIPRLYQKTFPFESQKLVEFLSDKAGKKDFLGISIIHYIGFVVILVSPFVFYKIFALLLGLILRLILGKITEEQQRQNKIRRLARPLSLFVTFTLIARLIPIFQFPALISYYILTTVQVALPFFAVIMSIGIINVLAFYFEKSAKKRQNIFLEQVIPFVQTSLHVLAIIYGVVILLDTLNVNITALIAGLSIGGLAIALAAQETIKNLFGSITIFVDRPFKVGDWITAEGIDGEVEEIGFRSTRVRSFHNSVIYVPNGRMADMTVDNFGLRIYRRFRTFIGITFDTPLPLLKAFIHGIRAYVIKHPKTRKDYYVVQLFDLVDYSLNIQFNIFIIAGSYEEECVIREEIIISILELAKDLGVRFAYPTQTLHIENFPEKKSLTPEYEKLNEDFIDLKVSDFIQRKFKED